ncbi:hypothetical protein H4F49_18855 [Pectobacterium polaris]|nr:hypothetical protein [Pectobacterium polaris]MBN3082684.1 hypothetical protein [Pectobacterium polaris]
MLDYNTPKTQLAIFFILLSFCIIALVLSVYYSSIALIGGYEYKTFPKYKDTNSFKEAQIDYINKLIRYNEKNNNNIKVPDLDKSIKDEILKSLGKSSDYNNKVNHERMVKVRSSMINLFISLLFFSLLAIFYALLDLDASSPNKNMLVKDNELSIQLKILNKKIGSIMCNDNPEKKPSEIDHNEITTECNTEKDSPPIPPTFPEPQAGLESYDIITQRTLNDKK